MGNKTDSCDAVISGFIIFSYEERLKMMVLREEFFPLMDEVKNSVAVMTKAANGNISHTSTKAANSPNFGLFLHRPWLIFMAMLRFFVSISFSSLLSELLDCDDLHSVIRLVLKAGNYMNAVGIFLSELYYI